ncbi:hypothetical protein [Rhizobium leguminosarum]|uniref:hypothetical protein n=1 Tax=Rhizobium leguminosarum TaxID=384 RepID=UPI0013BB806E|nr:hypothetical protein [Rhizobium leguminosarum]NEI60917.1 hypothetical protein [Rhizobium leguminosarum]
MFVRQLIGREAGTIINMPFTAAQSCLAMGTAGEVTDEEIAAAGLEPEPVVVNRPDELPHGFRVETIPGGGFDLYDPGGVNISKDVDLPNLIAARDLAWSIMHPAEAARHDGAGSAEQGRSAEKSPMTRASKSPAVQRRPRSSLRSSLPALLRLPVPEVVEPANAGVVSGDASSEMNETNGESGGAAASDSVDAGNENQGQAE